MIDTKIEINFQINEEFLPYGENKPAKTAEEYEDFIMKEIEVLLRGLYPKYENLNITVT